MTTKQEELLRSIIWDLDVRVYALKVEPLGNKENKDRLRYAVLKKKSVYDKALQTMSEENKMTNPCCIECGETEKRVLTQSRGKDIWSCWDCDNKRSMQNE